VAIANSTKAYRSAHCGPIWASAMAIGALTAAATVPVRLSRELPSTRVNPVGSTRGTADDFVTPYALDDTRIPSALRNRPGELVSTEPTRVRLRTPRTAMVPPMAHRRPRR